MTDNTTAASIAASLSAEEIKLLCFANTVASFTPNTTHNTMFSDFENLYDRGLIEIIGRKRHWEETIYQITGKGRGFCAVLAALQPATATDDGEAEGDDVLIFDTIDPQPKVRIPVTIVDQKQWDELQAELATLRNQLAAANERAAKAEETLIPLAEIWGHWLDASSQMMGDEGISFSDWFLMWYRKYANQTKIAEALKQLNAKMAIEKGNIK